MNILLVGPYFANGKHGAEPGIYDALIELGHNVSIWDYRKNSIKIFNGIRINGIVDSILDDQYDIILCPGAGLPDSILESKIWKKLDGLKVLWNSEPIRLPNYRDRIFKQKNEYNIHFTFDESEIPLYKKLGINAIWLPQAYNPNWYYPDNLAASMRFNNTLVFIGSIGGKWLHRQHLIAKVQSLGFKVNVATIFDAEKVNKAYNCHEAVLNLGLYIPEAGPPEDLKGFALQQRIFESYGARKIVITNEIPSGTNNLFIHGEDILFYNTNTLKDVIEIALNKKERKRMEDYIGQHRYKHTYRKRMERLIEIANL